MAADVDWRVELERWLEPFLVRLAHPARRAMCPLCVAGLIGPGDRKSVQPMAERLGLLSHDGLHHFIAAGVWEVGPLETELMVMADRLVGGPDAYLVIDDTALPKKGSHSVGVAPQYASALGKNANCQTLVSLTISRGEVPVPVSLRLFLPESWTKDHERLICAGVPQDYCAFRTKPRTPRTNGMVERFNGRIGREVLVMCVGTHNALERLLHGYNLACNARRQRVLNGHSPDDVVRERLREKPQLANPAYRSLDPSHVTDVTAEAQRAVISAKNVSQPDN